MEAISPLNAVSPLDGRYHSRTIPLSPYFSEGALFRYRLWVEVEYFIALVQFVPALKLLCESALWEGIKSRLQQLFSETDFNDKALQRLKELESVTNHDVKAVEYYLKEQAQAIIPSEFHSMLEYIHFGLTSQDINNTAIPLLMKNAIFQQIIPTLEGVIKSILSIAVPNIDLPMLAHTHGQPATPVRLGQALMVFVYRVRQQLRLLNMVPFSGKFGGATGGLNAHYVAYPELDWLAFADVFVSSLGLEREQWTTQISNYDNLAAVLDGLRRINIILLGLCKDMWQYISMDYFKQKIYSKEVGSSAMPHKVNPIDFENAEGNLQIANSHFDFMSSKLPVSRLQRDLTDSTVLRTLGVPLGHTLIAFNSLQRGLGKIIVNVDRISAHLGENYIVISEAIQTVLRRVGYPHPYETLKELTRHGQSLTSESFEQFIMTLDVSDEVKSELRSISPFTFIGRVPPLDTI